MKKKTKNIECGEFEKQNKRYARESVRHKLQDFSDILQNFGNVPKSSRIVQECLKTIEKPHFVEISAIFFRKRLTQKIVPVKLDGDHSYFLQFSPNGTEVRQIDQKRSDLKKSFP